MGGQGRLQAESLKSRSEEGKFQRELAKLQTGTASSIERIRVETAEAYEREARLLRELRDPAQVRVPCTSEQSTAPARR